MRRVVMNEEPNVHLKISVCQVDRPGRDEIDRDNCLALLAADYLATTV